MEQHHIVPRSNGGPDTPGNMVLLTVREHYLAHLLLAHLPGSDNQWFSVHAILQDALNIRRPYRFHQVRYKAWIRKRIAYQQAIDLRKRAKAKNVKSAAAKAEMIDEIYIRDLFDLAGMGDLD
jgi:hypothetical protein